MTSDEIMTDIINTIKSELSYKNILTLNKANIPLLSSFYTLWDSVNLIYSAVSNGNGNQLVMGVRKIVILLLVSCLKTSQFGFKTVGDITNFFCSFF